MKDEEWLKGMKERLEDFTEPAPLSGWERLEKDLSASSAPIRSRRAFLYRYWGVSAAAALLLAVSTVSIWMLNSSLPEEVGHAVPVAMHRPVAMQASPESSVEMEKSDEIQLISSVERTFEVPHTQALLSVSDKDTVQVDVQEEILVKNEGVATGPQESATAPETIQNGDKDVDESFRRERYRPSGSDKYHFPAARSTNEKQSRWSVALALGNTGGFASQHSTGYSLLQQTSALSVGGKLDLSATSNGLLAIPAGQEVIFRDGIPYLSNRGPVIESMEHKQPVSVGMSVRKVLSKGFSIETGS